MRFPATFGARVRFYRVSQGLTVRALADATGLSEATIYLLEQDRSRAHAATQHKLAAVLGVTVAHLHGEVGLLDNLLPEEQANATPHSR